MRGGQGLFERWRGRSSAPAAAAPPAAIAAVGLQVWLDDAASVQRLAGPLCSALDLPTHSHLRLHDCVQPHSLLMLEGQPVDWQAQPLDLDFKALGGGTLHTRGWLLAQAGSWLLQMFDIGDLLQHRKQSLSAERQRHLTSHLATELRGCSIERLGRVAQEQLQWLVHHWRASSGRILLPGEQGWRTYASSSDPLLWPSDEVIGPLLDRLAPGQMVASTVHAALHELMPQTEAYLLPYAQGPVVRAWLICVAPLEALDEVSALSACAAFAEPLVSRLMAHDLQQQRERLDGLQLQLGAGWWQWCLNDSHLQLDPGLAARLGMPAQLTISQWLSRVHPADREAAQLALGNLQHEEGDLHLSVRLLDHNLRANPRWYRLCGRVRGSGAQRRVQGFMLDISEATSEQLQASVAQTRLEQLMASSPAVIYRQRYVEGALHTEFFSACLQRLLGWAPDGEEALQPGAWVHPDDQLVWTTRTHTLLREGLACNRYRVRDRLGGYHWVVDQARLLRDDRGLPLAVTGVWLALTATPDQHL